MIKQLIVLLVLFLFGIACNASQELSRFVPEAEATVLIGASTNTPDSFMQTATRIIADATQTGLFIISLNETATALENFGVSATPNSNYMQQTQSASIGATETAVYLATQGLTPTRYPYLLTLTAQRNQLTQIAATAIAYGCIEETIDFLTQSFVYDFMQTPTDVSIYVYTSEQSYYSCSDDIIYVGELVDYEINLRIPFQDIPDEDAVQTYIATALFSLLNYEFEETTFGTDTTVLYVRNEFSGSPIFYVMMFNYSDMIESANSTLDFEVFLDSLGGIQRVYE